MNSIFYIISSIKNGQLNKKKIIFLKYKFQNKVFLNLLWKKRLILGYKKIKNNNIQLFLKYSYSSPIIKNIKIVSVPSKRIYFSTEKIWKINKKNNIFIFSTVLGLQFLEDCKKQNVGGELVAIIN